MCHRILHGGLCPLFSLCLVGGVFGAPQNPNPNHPGVLEPALSATTGTEVRIPHTDQAQAGTLLNVVGPIARQNAQGATSLTGHVITDKDSPNRALRDAAKDLRDAAAGSQPAGVQSAAQELMDILLGNTQGRIFDGFALLNYNRGAFVPDHEAGEYKMKRLRDSGLTQPGIDGMPRKVWEVDVAMLWYDGQFDSDTFLLRVPVDAHPYDTLRVHYRIYSLVKEDFAPTAVMLDNRLTGSVQFPFKGFDAVWTDVGSDEVVDITVDYPPLRLLRGVYHWGWRVHPPRIQFLQPVYEITNVHTGAVELEPQGKSYAFRNAQLSIDDIGAAAPEKKLYTVAQAALGGASPAQILAMMEDPNTAPRGTWQEWTDLASDERQLPPEAWDVLAAEGIPQGSFGPYEFVTAYMNNEMYGEGPNGEKIRGWAQGDQFKVKVINLDNHTHYFRNVDFGPRLHDDIGSGGFSSGSHSFEIMSFKPTYGAPKVAEVQWRAGWGFRPHFDVIQQADVFSRAADQIGLQTFYDGSGTPHTGWQYSAGMRGADFRFNPPPFIITNTTTPAAFPLREFDATDGLLIGQTTEGYGVARMCTHAQHPKGQFCQIDISAYNPYGIKNVATGGSSVPNVLWFPPFLRNPGASGGDIIPPTPAWKPFLWINPNNGTLFIDPLDPSQGYWSDLTYAHGTPVPVAGSLSATIEAPRASAQVFYQFDDLFHDNAIFSPHPTFAPEEPQVFCSAKVNSCGTLPAISALGTPSATSTSGFVVSAGNTRAAKAGLLIYTDAGRIAPAPFQGGLLCISTQPLKRSIAIVDSTGTPGQCDGRLSIDMNAFARGLLGGNPLASLGLPGTQVDCQVWARDTLANGSLLSDALEYRVLP